MRAHVHTPTHTHTCTCMFNADGRVEESEKGPKSVVISHFGGKFFHLDTVFTCVQRVFLGKSFIIGEQSPLAQSPKVLRENWKRDVK